MRAFSRTVASILAVLTLAAGASACSRGNLDEPNMTSVSSTADEDADSDGGDKDTDDSEKDSEPKKAKADCSDEAFSRSFNEEPMFGWYHEGCEGDFVVIGPGSSDSYWLAQWDGSKWNKVDGDEVVEPKDGKSFVCFNESTVDRLGVGPKIKSQLRSCETHNNFGDDSGSKKKESSDDGSYSYDRVKDDDGYITNVGLGEAGKKASYPACDGRYILILDSIIATGSDQDTFNRLAQSVMFADPSGKEFTIPGQCDSLRKTYHGNDVYPIYLDFGSDKAAACRAKSTYGGNVRPLIDGDFDDASSQDVDDARMALDPC